MSKEPSNTPRPVISRSRIAGGLAAVAIAIGGIVAVQAVAETRTYQHIATEVGYQVGFHRAGHKRLSEMSDEEIETRIARVVRHITIEIDATDDQEKKIVALVTAVARDLKPMRQGFVQSRDEVHDLLLADTIDREALERLRAERIAEFDQMSKNLVAAVADVAEVLTPEQRRTLETRIKEFHEHFGGQRSGGRWRH